MADKILLVSFVIFSIFACKVKCQQPHGIIHIHSEEVDTQLLPNTTALEYTTQFTFDDIQLILATERTTYLVTDNQLKVITNGTFDETSVAIDDRCIPQRFEPPLFGVGTSSLHCYSSDTGRPSYVFIILPTISIFRQFPTTASYLPQRKNSILTRALDIDGSEVEYIVVIAGDATSVLVYQTSTLSTRSVEFGQYCDEITAITHQPPKDGRIRFTLTCLKNGQIKYYSVHLERSLALDTCNELRMSSTGNVLSLTSSGDHVCMIEVSTVTCFATTQPNSAGVSRSVSGNISNAEFLDDNFFLVEVNGFQQTLFAVSSTGQHNLPGSEASCNTGKCLPHLVVDHYLLLFKRNGTYFRAYLYDLDSPLSAPTYRGKTRFKPEVTAFEFREAPPTTEPPTDIQLITTEETTPTQQTDMPTEPNMLTVTTEKDTPTTSQPTSNSTSTAEPVINIVMTISISAVLGVALIFVIFLIVVVIYRSRSQDPENGYIKCWHRCKHKPWTVEEELKRNNPLGEEKQHRGKPLQETGDSAEKYLCVNSPSPSVSPNLSCRSSDSESQNGDVGIPLMSISDRNSPAELVAAKPVQTNL